MNEKQNKNQTQPGCRARADITYPCRWEYKVIGTSRDRLEQIIGEACAPARPEIRLSNVSSTGKYCSLNATLEVDSEAMRLGIFKQLQAHQDVTMVL